ncbi:MAG TPA: hypothetical protein VK935_21005 [Actinomycetospora sp.]|nr:hypothetical protein [Actinomycetospora sp.]
MGVGTRWWRRDDAEAGTDVWGGPNEVTVAPVPRRAPEDAGVDADTSGQERECAEREQAERERAEREQRERTEREQAERERAEQVERERAEQVEREQRERAERERAERERAERERVERERAERERVDRLQRAREEQQRADRERRERQRAEQERRVAARQEQARREREERERREQAQRASAGAGSDDTTRIPLVDVPVADDQDRVTTLPGPETVPPALARDSAAREAAARQAAAADRKRRRRQVLSVFLVALLAVAAVWILPRLVALTLSLFSALGGVMPPVPAPIPVAAAATPAPDAERPELPRGGTTIAPGQRVVALRVGPVATPEETADLLDATATPFTTTDRSVLPALELPVRDAATDAPAAWEQLAVTRAHRQVLLLAVATGPTGVGETIAPWERLLREPDVGLALDAPAPLPAGEIAATSERLAVIVRDADLPQKLLVVPAPAADSTVPAEVALVAVPGDAVTAPVLRGVVIPPDGRAPREVLAAAPSPDVVLLR